MNSVNEIEPNTPMNSPLASRSRLSRGWAAFLISLFAVSLAFVLVHRLALGHSTQSKSALPPAVPIATAVAKKGDLGVYLNALGTVTPVYTDTITSRVTGQIMSVNYREGQMVSKGTVLE